MCSYVFANVLVLAVLLSTIAISVIQCDYLNCFYFTLNIICTLVDMQIVLFMFHIISLKKIFIL